MCIKSESNKINYLNLFFLRFKYFKIIKSTQLVIKLEYSIEITQVRTSDISLTTKILIYET